VQARVTARLRFQSGFRTSDCGGIGLLEILQQQVKGVGVGYRSGAGAVGLSRSL